jgi:hypothetical protein
VNQAMRPIRPHSHPTAEACTPEYGGIEYEALPVTSDYWVLARTPTCLAVVRSRTCCE